VRFDGQLAVFDLREAGSSCYACLFPEGDAQDETVFSDGRVRTADRHRRRHAGAEALKLVAGAGESAAGRLLMLDVLTMDVRTVRFCRRPALRGLPGRPGDIAVADRAAGDPMTAPGRFPVQHAGPRLWLTLVVAGRRGVDGGRAVLPARPASGSLSVVRAAAGGRHRGRFVRTCRVAAHRHARPPGGLGAGGGPGAARWRQSPRGTAGSFGIRRSR